MGLQPLLHHLRRFKLQDGFALRPAFYTLGQLRGADRRKGEKKGVIFEDVYGKRSIIKYTAQGAIFEHIALYTSKIKNMSCSRKVTIQTSISPAKGTLNHILFHSSISLELISFDAQRRVGSKKSNIGNL